MQLLIENAQVAPALRDQALKAAVQVLAQAGVTPYEGASALFKLEGERDALTAAESAAVNAWQEAEDAAREVLGHTCHLELDRNPEGSLWVGPRASGAWVWEVLVTRLPDGQFGVWSGQAPSETVARDKGAKHLDAVRGQLLR